MMEPQDKYREVESALEKFWGEEDLLVGKGKSTPAQIALRFRNVMVLLAAILFLLSFASNRYPILRAVGYDKNNEPYYYNLSSKEAYELYTTCILPDLGDSSMGVRHYVNFPTMETAEYSWVDISVELDMSDSWVPSDRRASRTEETYSLNYYYDLTPDAARSLAYAEAHGFLVP